MATWTQTFSVNNKYSLTLECTEQSYSIPNNTSVVAWKLTMATAAYSYTGYADYRTTVSVSINGTQVYSYNASRDFNPQATSSYSEVLASGTATVAHNNDGTKSCACAASVTVASGTYSPGTASISQTLALTTIPRASSASWSGDFTIGTGKAITITAATSSFRHELTFTVGSATASASVAAGTTSYTWTPASGTFASQFPTQTSRTGTMVLKTYNGSNLIGSTSYSFTLKIPDSWKPSTPSITLSPVNSNAWLAGKGIYVQGYTQTRVRATSTASAGTTISSWSVSGAASMTQSGTSLDKTSGVIASSGSKSFTVTVTDARGRTASASASASYVSYSAPAVTSMTVTRGTYSGGTWTASDSGSDLRAVFKAACSLSGNGNVMAWSIGAPFNVSGTALANNGTITEYVTGVGTTTAYTPTVTVTDELGSSGSKSVLVPTIEIPFVVNVTKPAIGVGAVPQTERTLELADNWMVRPGGGIAGAALSGAAPSTPTANIIIPVGRIAGAAIGAASGASDDFLTALMPYLCAAYPGRNRCRFTGTGLSDVSLFFDYLAYETGNVNGSGYPQYSFGEALVYGGSSTYGAFKYRFGTVNYVPYVIKDTLVSVKKTATVSFAAGTIGTRGYQTSWSSTSIGGTPKYVQITHVANSANYLPIAFIEGTTVYFNAYRCVSSAVSNSTVDVTIYYQ